MMRSRRHPGQSYEPLLPDPAAKYRVRPALLRQLNERAVFEIVRDHGPISRADLARQSGITAPTASKVVGRLLRSGFLEEVKAAANDAAVARAGRPSKVYRLGARRVQVLGATIDVRRCSVVASGLDGRIDPEHVVVFNTPDTYAKLIDAMADSARKLMNRPVATLGMGISTPGEIDMKRQRVLLSPNLHITDGRSPGIDLQDRLGIETVLLHETVGTCQAERAYGIARRMNDFVMIGVYEGFGVSVVSGGRLLAGKDMMAGELGHVTVDLNGIKCGCGNTGCLETVATDPAFARAVSARLGRPMEVEEVIRQAQAKSIDFDEPLQRTLEYLAVGIAAAINIFNPEAVLVCAHMLDARPDGFDMLKQAVARRALSPLFQSCQLLRVEGNTRQGAVAGIIQHLTRSLWPAID